MTNVRNRRRGGMRVRGRFVAGVWTAAATASPVKPTGQTRERGCVVLRRILLAVRGLSLETRLIHSRGRRCASGAAAGPLPGRARAAPSAAMTLPVVGRRAIFCLALRGRVSLPKDHRKCHARAEHPATARRETVSRNAEVRPADRFAHGPLRQRCDTCVRTTHGIGHDDAPCR